MVFIFNIYFNVGKQSHRDKYIGVSHYQNKVSHNDVNTKIKYFYNVIHLKLRTASKHSLSPLY